MPFIETPAESDLFGPDEAAAGFVHNYTRLFAHRPEVYRAWAGLAGATKGGMDLRRFELATLAAARTLRSSYCALAHGQALTRLGFDADDLIAVMDGNGRLDPVDAAVMAFAAQIADDATAVTQHDVDRLRDLGLSDIDILDVALAASLRCFFSKTLDALGVQPDAEYRDQLGDDLVTALAVGRPVAEA